MKMVDFFAPETTMKIKHFRRGAHSKGNTCNFLVTIADGKKQLIYGEKGRNTAKKQPEQACGWVGPWALIDLR